MSRLYFPATERNRQPIWDVLSPRLKPAGTYLEVASGSGEHLAYFAQQSGGRQVRWIPSDPLAEHRLSIADWCQELPHVAAPLDIDCRHPRWQGVDEVDGILAINMVHIAPWSACVGLFAGAARHLSRRGWLYLYGAYFCADVDTAPSNLAFDQSLRQQNPEWGVRQLEQVTALALEVGLVLVQRTQMPANNLSLLFQRERGFARSLESGCGTP
jgi:hypothetical protein